jgi:hypothetical protein
MDFTSHGCWGGGRRQDRCGKKEKKRYLLLYRIPLIIVTQVLVQKENEMYIVENVVNSGKNSLLPNFADRWQGTTKKKVKLESLGTRKPYQLWILEYSEQSHVEVERETHGNINIVVRSVIATLVVLLLCVLLDTSNTGYIELTFFRKFFVKTFNKATGLLLRLSRLQLGLNDEYECRDNLDVRGDSSMLCFNIINDSKWERVGESFLFYMPCTDAYESDYRLMHPAQVNVKKCGLFSKRVLLDMSFIFAYENGDVLNMLKLQIALKFVQSSTGGYSCR